ncbi:MAG: glycosyltransferase, partial [Candidatus Omnitrophica bacterium]|nr:glycosyltransferase [Candidatus Omnitrophota bacterium]
KAQLDKFQEEVNRLDSQLKERMDELRRAYEDRDSQLAERDAQMDGLRRELEELSSQMQVNLKELSAREENILIIRQQSEELQNKLNEFADELRRAYEDRDSKLAERDAQMDGLRQHIEDSELKPLKNEIERLTAELAGRMDEVLIKDGQLIEKEVIIDSLKKDAGDIDDNNKSLSGENVILRSQLDKVREEIAEKDNRLSRDKQEIDSLRGQLDARPPQRREHMAVTDLIWLAVVLVMMPLYFIASAAILLEGLVSFLAAPVSGLFRIKRRIVSFEDLKTSMVIPNYNGVEFLKECLPSVFAAEGFRNGENEVIVVDDGSKDGSAAYIKSNFPQVRLIRNRRNRGFGFTCNRGVRYAKNELIVLINNDIIVTENFLGSLREHFRDKDVFAVTPKMYGWDKQSFTWGMHMGHFEDGYIRLWNESETKNPVHISEPGPSLFAIGGAMVFRKNDWDWLGGFDRIYRPNCWEDIDIGYRAWKRGLKIIYEPSSVLYHKGRATLSYERHKEIKNELAFTWKNITDWEIVKEHLRLLPKNLYKYRMPFLRGSLWALRYLPLIMLHKFQDRKYLRVPDKKIFNGCMLYYRNFMRRGFKHRDASGRGTILLVTPFMPYPLTVGGKIRMHTLARVCAEKYDIILLTMIDNKDEARFIPELKQVFKEVYTVFPKTEMKSLFYPQRYKYVHSHDLIDKLREIQRSHPIDIVQIESNELLYLARYIKFIPIVYTEHDASIISFGKSLYQKKDSSFFYNYFDYLKKVRYHHYIYRFLDRVITLSRQDSRKMKAFFPRARISYIPSGVEVGHFTFKERRDNSYDLVFIGHYPHYPNEHTVVYFAEQILPLIREINPKARILIVGSHPTERVRQLAWQAGVELIGDVADVRPYLEKASIFVNAVKIGAGIKGKVLEAMAMGRPVVATRLGSYGIEARPGEDILIAGTPKQFASLVLRLMNDDELYSRVARNARRLVEEKYDWYKIRNKLDRLYEEVISEYELISGAAAQDQPYFVSNPVSAPAAAGLPPAAKNDPLIGIIDKTRAVVERAIENSRGGNKCGEPEELHIELTHNCNSKCIMCDLWDFRKRSPRAPQDLSLDEIRHSVEGSQLLKGIKTVVLSGGEPFLRKDIADIVSFFNSYYPRASIGILTNAKDSDLVMKNVDKIVSGGKAPGLWLGSSLDGIGGWHDKIRGVPGAFDGLLKTARALKRDFPQIDFSVTMTLTPHNAGQLLPAKEFADREGLNFFAQFVVPKAAREKFRWDAQTLGLIGSQVRRIIEDIIGSRDYTELSGSIENIPDVDLLTKIYYWGHLVEHQVNPRRFFKECVAGYKFAMLNPYGDLFFCPVFKEKTAGNIRMGKFDELWLSEEAEDIRRFVSCRACSCWLVCIVFPIVSNALATMKSDTGSSLSAPSPQGRGSASCRGSLSREENINLNDEEFRSGKIILESHPRGIGIGAHFKCNSQCSFCRTDEHAVFSLDIYRNFFEKKIGDILPRADYLNLCGFGELLLMPDADVLLDDLNVKLPEVNKVITTNGSTLSDGIVRRLVESRYAIQVSLHAANPQIHKILTRTLDFHQIISRIKHLVSLRENRANPHITLVSVLNALNIEDLPNLVRLAAELGVDGINCNYMLAFNTAHLKMSCFFKQEVTNKKLDEAEKAAQHYGMPISLPPRFGAAGAIQPSNGGIVCSDPWQYIYIETEGSVLPCCVAGGHIGYLNKQDFSAIWNGPGYQRLRRSLIERRDLGEWCKHCYKCSGQNVNDLRTHITLIPELHNKILNEIKI